MDGYRKRIFYTPFYEMTRIDGMTKAAIHVMSCIIASVSLSRGEWPFCFASYAAIGASTNYSVSSVAKSVSILRKLGLIVTQKIEGGVNAIYPTELVLSVIERKPANIRISYSYTEHHRLYEQRHGRPYRDNPERDRKLRMEHATAIEEGAARLNLRYNNIANAQHIGDSPAVQGNAVTSLEQMQVVDDDGCGNQEFFVPQRFVQKAFEPSKKEEKPDRKRIHTQRPRRTIARQSASHPSASQEQKVPWDPTLNVPRECREWLDYSMNREFHSSPVPGMSPQEFGLTYFMWKHPEYIARIQDVIPSVPRPLNAYIVQEYSKSSALFGPRRSRCMSYGEAEEFYNYNTGKWNNCWYGFIASFVGRLINRDDMDNLEYAHWGECEMDCNYTQEASRLYRDVINNGGDYEDFLDYYRNVPHRKAA